MHLRERDADTKIPMTQKFHRVGTAVRDKGTSSKEQKLKIIETITQVSVLYNSIILR